MARIRKIWADAQKTEQILPVTHERAVRDDSGRTLESKLGALKDLIDAGRMAEGDVPLDITPTAGNTTHVVTSDGVARSVRELIETMVERQMPSWSGTGSSSWPSTADGWFIFSGTGISITREGKFAVPSSTQPERYHARIYAMKKGTVIHAKFSLKDSAKDYIRYGFLADLPRDGQGEIMTGDDLKNALLDSENPYNTLNGFGEEEATTGNDIDMVLVMPYDGYFSWYNYQNTTSGKVTWDTAAWGCEIYEPARLPSIVDEMPTAASGNLVTSGGVKALDWDRVMQMTTGRLGSEIGMTTDTRSAWAIDTAGVVQSAPSTTYKVSVFSKKLPKGTLMRFTATSTTGRRMCFCAMNTDPYDAGSPIGPGTQLTVLRNVNINGAWDIVAELPFDGWFIYYWYNANWSGRTVTYYLPTEVASIGKSVDAVNKRVDSILEGDLLEDFMAKYTYYSRKFLRGDTGHNGSTYGITGYYYTTDYVYVGNYTLLNYKLPFPNAVKAAWGGVAMIAAFDENKNYLPENSVIYMAKNATGKGVWVRGENTMYARFTIYHKAGAGKYYAVDPSNFEYRISALESFAEDPNNILVLNRDREGILAQTTWNGTMAGAYKKDWLRLAHFSDLHGDTKRLRRIVEWCQAHDDIINDCVNTGDTVANKYSNDNPFESVPGSENILTIVGNHDCAGKTSGVTDWYKNRGVNVYNKFFKPYISTTEEVEVIDEETGEKTIETITTDNWEVVQPEGAEENGLCYWYKDYDGGFRLIALDAMSYAADGEQRTWFHGVLDDARTQGLTVVCAFHFCIRAKHAVKTNFATWGSGNGSGYGTQTIDGVTIYNSAGSIFNDVQDFIDAGGQFACHLVGHSHADKIFYVGSQSSYEGSTPTRQLAIQVDAACCTSSADHWSTKRVAEGRTQDSFNVVCVNKTDKRIIIIKIGCDSNIVGQHVDWVSIGYGGATTEQEQTVGNVSYIAESIVDPDHDDDGDVN